MPASRTGSSAARRRPSTATGSTPRRDRRAALLDVRTGRRSGSRVSSNFRESISSKHGRGCPLIVYDRLLRPSGRSQRQPAAALDAAGRLGDLADAGRPDRAEQPHLRRGRRHAPGDFLHGRGRHRRGPARRQVPGFKATWKTQYDLNIATPIVHDDLPSSPPTTAHRRRPLPREGDVRTETTWTGVDAEPHLDVRPVRGRMYGFSESRLRCVDLVDRPESSGTGPAWVKRLAGRSPTGDRSSSATTGQPGARPAHLEKYTELSRCQVFEKKALTWTVPVSGGRLFAASTPLKAQDVSGKGR